MASYDSKQIKNIVKRRHPEYEEQHDHWDFCELSYRGGREYMNENNVFRYYKEGTRDYEDRLKRTYRANHTRRVVDTINQYLFKPSILRKTDEAPDSLNKFWEDPLGDGTKNMDGFMKELDQWLSVFGRVYVVVDSDRFDAYTVAESEDIGGPYAYMVFPQRVFDMSFDDSGELVWITIAEERRDDADPADSTGQTMIDVRLWTRDAWYLFGKRNPRSTNYDLLDSGPNNLGMVPVVIVEADEGTKWSSPALISDIAYMDRAVVNYGSALDEVIYGQTFSQLAIPMSGLSPGTADYNNAVSAARNRIFLFENPDGNSAPFYLSPDASQGALIMDAMQSLMKQIYAVTGTDNEASSQSMSKGKEYASGVVRQIDYTSMENMLVSKAQALESAEEKIAHLVLEYAGDEMEFEDIRGLVSYPIKFDVKGLAEDLSTAQILTEIAAPQGIMKEHLKNLLDKIFPRLTQETRKKLEADIEAWESQPSFDREMQTKEMDMRGKEVDIKQQVADKPVPKPAPAAKPAKR